MSKLPFGLLLVLAAVATAVGAAAAPASRASLLGGGAAFILGVAAVGVATYGAFSSGRGNDRSDAG